MTLRLRWTHRKKGKLVKARESWPGIDREDSILKNCKPSIRTGGSKVVIYRGGSDSEENQVKVEFPVNYEV